MILMMMNEFLPSSIRAEDWAATPPAVQALVLAFCSHGAQTGHEAQTRDLVPPDQVNEFVSYHPTVCPYCETSLAPDLPNAAPIYHHQVWDIPPIKRIITEYHLHAVCCPSCQKNVRAALPWLWIVVTPIVTLFHIDRSRWGAVWRALLGTVFAGILGSDRLAAYNTHPVERRQRGMLPWNVFRMGYGNNWNEAIRWNCQKPRA